MSKKNNSEMPKQRTLGDKLYFDRLNALRKGFFERFPIILVFVFSMVSVNSIWAVDYTVNSTADPGTGSGTTGSLRYCITTANATAGSHSVELKTSDLNPGIYIYTINSNNISAAKRLTVIK